MNERMLELWLQARKEAHDNLKTSEWETRRFAELIVKECCNYLNQEAERLYALKSDNEQHTEDYEICAEKCLDNIQGLKDHFGVK